MRRNLAVLATLGILVLVNASIFEKQQHLAEGEAIYLELAPVDPRSLMQGDYMALRFVMGNEIERARRANEDAKSRKEASDGYAIVALDEQGVASFKRLDQGGQPLADNERRIFYRMRNGQLKFATNAFFFQEGHAERYEQARYGLFRLNEKGIPLLVSLHNSDLKESSAATDLRTSPDTTPRL